MKIDLVQSYELSASRYDLAVVVDVLRFTTTAGVLLSRTKRLLVASELDALNEAVFRDIAPLVFSELSGVPEAYAREDNSPAVAARVELGERIPVLITTNGTVTVAAASAIADHVILAGFPYIGAVAQTIKQRWSAARVAIVSAAGYHKRVRRTEDDACSEALLDLLEDRVPNFASIEERCRADSHIHERLARNSTLEEDVAMAFRPNAYSLVPIVEKLDSTRCFSVGSL